MTHCHDYQIPFNGLQRQYHNLRTEILEVTDRVLQSGQLMSGQYTQDFEQWLANKNHVEYAVCCHSGTQALEIIAEYYRSEISISPPRVLLPALSFPATANAFARAGWQIRFVDTDSYGILNYEKINRDESIHAMCVVGLYGHSVSQNFNHFTNCLIEDAAQHWLSNNCVRRGQAAAISFDPTKNLANFGNGGAVVTNDQQLSQFARDWTQHGKLSNHHIPGSNSRMSEIDCAQMLVKTQYIDQWQQRRKQIAQYWITAFKDLPIRCLVDQKNFDTHCVHKFVIEVDNRDELAKKLASNAIETKIHYSTPLWNLSAFESQPKEPFFSAAEILSRRVLSLPIYPELTDLEVEYVVDQISKNI